MHSEHENILSIEQYLVSSNLHWCFYTEMQIPFEDTIFCTKKNIKIKQELNKIDTNRAQQSDYLDLLS